jgi:Trypsin
MTCTLFKRLVTICAVAALAYTPLRADVVQKPAPQTAPGALTFPRKLEFKPLPQCRECLSTQLVPTGQTPNFIPVQDFPSARYVPDSGCTGTFVGPRVFLTAAHCVADKRKARLPAPYPEESPFEGECRTPSDYAQSANYTADFALCYSQTHSISAKDNGAIARLLNDTSPDDKAVLRLDPNSTPRFVFERIETKPDWLKATKRLFITGYGCTSLAQNSHEHQLNGSFATIYYAGQLLNGGKFSKYGRIWQNNRLTTVIRGANEGILCAGDSGGATFHLLDGTQKGRRAIVAVNSGNVFRDGHPQSVSHLASLSSPGFRQFLTAWLAHYPEAQICGLDRPQDRALKDLCHG